MTDTAAPPDRAPSSCTASRPHGSADGGVLLGILLAALTTIVGTMSTIVDSSLHGNDVYVWAFTSYLLTARLSDSPVSGKLWTSSHRTRS